MLHLTFKFKLVDPKASAVANGVVFSHNYPPTMTWEQVAAAENQARYTLVVVGREWPAYAWPGGYPMFYTVKDGSVLSAKAANEHLDRTLDPDDDQFFIVGQHINWEDDELRCDHTNELIPPAYDKVQS